MRGFDKIIKKSINQGEEGKKICFLQKKGLHTSKIHGHGDVEADVVAVLRCANRLILRSRVHIARKMSGSSCM